MYLTNLMKDNPALLEKVFEFHQAGMIPPNSWVIDLDRIAANARILSAKAHELGLETYLMSKQHNRNPYINMVAMACGLGKLVAVDVQGVLSAERYQMPLGHAGHLNQIPRQYSSRLLALNPDIVTVYNIDHARWLDEAASMTGEVQNLMIRVREEGDLCFDGQEGGLSLLELEAFADEIKNLDHVSLRGVTSFPCVRYNENAREKAELTANADTVLEAAEILKGLGFPISQINMPGNTGSSIMASLKAKGATHVEPGNALLGTTPDNAFHSDTPEKTAFAYVTEVSHKVGKRAYAYGGGVYHTNYSDEISALVGTSFSEAKDNRVEYDHSVKQDIDYHMQLVPSEEQRCRTGDTVLFAYRTQMHMTRSWIVPISGLSGEREMKLHYFFDNGNNAFDREYRPVAPDSVCRDIGELVSTY